MLKIKLESHENYEGDDLIRLKKSLLLLENTLNDSSFENKILNFSSDKTEGGTFHFIKYSGWLRRRRTDLKRYTNQEIYDKVMNGNEQIDDDSYMKLKLVLKRGSGGDTVGYLKNGIIHTYTTDFNDMSDGKLAAHLFHEYTHTLGFKHSKSSRKDPLRNCFSVPYALGNFIEILTTGSATRDCNY